MRYVPIAAIVATLALANGAALAQTFNSGSTGTDGALSPTTNTTLTLPPDGVFNFTTITIPSTVTVKFTRNLTNTPATLLATGNVTIAVTIDGSGVAGSPATNGATAVLSNGGGGGPGGFDGGSGATGIVSTTGGSGLGPGGGAGGTGIGAGGGGGGFATTGSNGTGGTAPASGGTPYGTPALVPLIGGSGGGGAGATFGNTGGGGGGGGGAIVVASSGTITLTGKILARGGSGGQALLGSPGGGAGSGGAVRLVATTVGSQGTTGTIDVAGGPLVAGAATASAGRVRIEAFTDTALISFPGAVAATLSTGAASPVTLSNAPTLRITAVAGVAAPPAPTASFASPDVVLPGSTTNPVTVALAASNIPLGTAVTVTVKGLNGAASSAVSGVLSGTLASSVASASVTIPTNEPSIISASATFTVAALDGPVFVDGEEVERIRVTAAHGEASHVAYVTRSGREVPAFPRR